MVWFPDWYNTWAGAQTPAYPIAATTADDIGTYTWGFPFVFYYEPYDVAHGLELQLASLTTVPTVGDTITQLNTGATLVVAYSSTVNNTIVGQDMGTGTWDTDPLNTITDGLATMVPSPATVVGLRLKDYDEFYAEPCGAFMVMYHECLFMAKVERTILVNAGYQTAGTLSWVFSPNEIMYSFPGYVSALQMGNSTRPPIYPFTIPNEPLERPWGCATAEGYPLNPLEPSEAQLSWVN